MILKGCKDDERGFIGSNNFPTPYRVNVVRAHTVGALVLVVDVAVDLHLLMTTCW